MTPKQILELTSAIIAVVQKDLIDPATGQFKTSSIAADIQAVVDVEQAFKAAGFVVPANLEKVIQILPLVAAILGVK